MKRKKILYIQYTNPAAYPPLEHSSRILADQGWKILFLGLGSYGGSDILRFPENPNIQVKRLAFYSRGWRQRLQYLLFLFWVILEAIKWRPDWIYASNAPSCPPAFFLNNFLRIKTIYHEHDSPLPAKQDSIFLKIVWWSRKKIAHDTEICILPNKKRTEAFISETKRSGNIFCVWNCPAKEESKFLHAIKNDRFIRLLYHGSIVPERLPLSVIESLTLLSANLRLCIVGYETIGHIGYINQIRNKATHLGVDDRIDIMSALSRKQLMEQCQKCDIGLSLMPKNSSDINMKYMVGASNKAFDYLACGLALLVSDLSDWKEMYVAPGYGIACDPENTHSITDSIRWFLDHPTEMKKMGDAGRRKILEEWNYENQFKPVLELLERG